MSKKAVALAPLSDLYRKAFDSCVALWPILIIRIIYLFLNLIFLFSGIVICFMPLLKTVYDNWNGFNQGDFKSLMSEVNWMSYFGDFNHLIIAALLTALAISFGGFFWAFFDAAVYSQINRHQKNGQFFSWKSFFDDGIKRMIPMMGLLCAWFLLFSGAILFFGFAALLGVLTVKLLSVWILVLLALPGGLVLIVAGTVFVTGGILSAAYLVDGHGIWDSVKQGLMKAIEHKGRAIWACVLIILVYLVFMTAFSVVFDVLARFPLIGFLFMIFKLLVTSVLAIGYSIYMTSLSVALQLEPKTPR